MLAIFGVGESELLVIMIVALIVFGGKLPEVARSLGKTLSEFKRSIRSFQEEMQREYYEAGEGRTGSYGSPGSYSSPYTPPEGYGYGYGDPYGTGSAGQAPAATETTTEGAAAAEAPAPPPSPSPPTGEAEKEGAKDLGAGEGSVPPMS